MPRKIDDLTVVFGLKDQFSKKLKSIGDRVSKFGSKLKSLAKVGLAAVVAGATAVTAALTKTFNANAPYIDALAKTADKLGVTTEALESFRDAAEFAGIGQASLDTSLQRYVRRLAEAATGAGKTAKELRGLGLDAAQLQSLGTEEAFKRTLSALEGVEDQTEKVRLAFAFFGKEGVDLVRLTSGAISESKDQMEQLNLSISRLDASRVEQANDALKRLGDITGAVGKKITVNVSGAVTVLTNRINDAISRMFSLGSSTGDTSRSILIAIGKVFDAFRIFTILIDSTKVAFLQLRIIALQSLGAIADIFDKRTLPLLAKAPGAIGEWATALQNAGGAFSKIDTKLEETIQKQDELTQQIFDKANAPSVITGLLAELDEVNRKSKVAADSLAAVVNAPTFNGDTSPIGASPVGSTSGPSERTSARIGSTDADSMANDLIGTVGTDAEASNDSINKLSDSFSALSNSMGVFADAAGKNNSKAFNSFKKLQIGLSIIASLSAAIKAATEVTGGPIARIAAYSTVLATLVAGVQQMKSINLGSTSTPTASGGGNSVSSTPTSTTTPSVANVAQATTTGPRRIINLTINGRDGYDADDIEELIEAINDNETTQIRSDRVA